MIELDRQCETAAHWSDEQYRSALPACGRGLTARLVLALEELGHPPDSPRTATLAGFLVARHLGLEWELENIVVASASRRKGLGTRLMEELLSRVRAVGSELIHLEVRESNLAARAFYERHQFEQAGRRRGYYSNPEEDAILYQRRLPRPK